MYKCCFNFVNSMPLTAFVLLFTWMCGCMCVPDRAIVTMMCVSVSIGWLKYNKLFHQRIICWRCVPCVCVCASYFAIVIYVFFGGSPFSSVCVRSCTAHTMPNGNTMMLSYSKGWADYFFFAHTLFLIVYSLIK